MLSLNFSITNASGTFAHISRSTRICTSAGSRLRMVDAKANRALAGGPATRRCIGARYNRRVCVHDAVVSIDGVSVTRTLTADGTSRPLFGWKQCRMLFDDELFLLNPAHVGSFDSRYFGPIDRSFVRGLAVPLSTPEPP